MKLYAIIVRELAYPCGNVCGIYENIDFAHIVKNKLEEKNDAYVAAGKNLDPDECTTFEIVEFDMNKFFVDSINGCAKCMTVMTDVANADGVNGINFNTELAKIVEDCKVKTEAEIKEKKRLTKIAKLETMDSCCKTPGTVSGCYDCNPLYRH